MAAITARQRSDRLILQMRLAQPTAPAELIERVYFLDTMPNTKNDLVAALKQAFAYCDGAYESMTDASAQQIVKFGGSGQSKFHLLNWNIWRTWEQQHPTLRIEDCTSGTPISPRPETTWTSNDAPDGSSAPSSSRRWRAARS
ncbi:MAG: hypothetical protein LAO77_17235 [Acidobacteriia bacterium]|nr:hypothetical protein [Terriglobia bacterium]